MPEQTGFARPGTQPQAVTTETVPAEQEQSQGRRRPQNERTSGVAAGFGAATGQDANDCSEVDVGLTPEAVVLMTGSVVAELDAMIRRRIGETPDFVATFVTATSTQSLTRNILRERLQGQVTDEALLAHMLEDASIFNSLHERYEEEVRNELAARSMDQLDGIVDGYIEGAANDIAAGIIEGSDARVNYCMGRCDKFGAWLQKMFKRILHAVASWDAPSKLFPKVRSIDLPESNAQMLMLWDVRSANMLHRGQYGLIENFPWIGRLPMYVPDDADEAGRNLVKQRRRIFAKSLMFRLYEVARSQTRS